MVGPLGGLFGAMDVSASGLAANKLRLDVIAGNVANVNTASRTNETPFRRRIVELQAKEVDSSAAGVGVAVRAIVEDPTPPRRLYDPQNPKADREGYVLMPTISLTQEMTDLVETSRAYEANATVLNSTKQIASRTVDLLR